jgi:hypothetical protein
MAYEKREWQPLESVVALDQFQEEAGIFAIFPENVRILYPAMGKLGEAGEYADVVLPILDRAIVDALAAKRPSSEIANLTEVRAAIYTAAQACKAVEKLKRPVREGKLALPPIPAPTPEETERLNGENGDSLWYDAVAALKNGQKLTTVVWKLVTKLRGRYDAKLLHASGETLAERAKNRD